MFIPIILLLISVASHVESGREILVCVFISLWYWEDELQGSAAVRASQEVIF